MGPREAGSAPHSNNDVGNNVGSQSSGRAPMWLVRNKIDLHQGLIRRNEQRVQSKGKNEPSVRVNSLTNMANEALREKNEIEFTFNELAFDVSATTGEGFDVLLAALAHHAGHFLTGAEPALVTRERHRHALQETVAALRRALAPDMSAARIFSPKNCGSLPVRSAASLVVSTLTTSSTLFSGTFASANDAVDKFWEFFSSTVFTGRCVGLLVHSRCG